MNRKRLDPKESSKLASLAFAVIEKREEPRVVFERLNLDGFAHDVGAVLIGRPSSSDEARTTAASISEWVSSQ